MHLFLRLLLVARGRQDPLELGIVPQGREIGIARKLPPVGWIQGYGAAHPIKCRGAVAGLQLRCRDRHPRFVILIGLLRRQ
jgi:hypothetical protein